MKKQQFISGIFAFIFICLICSGAATAEASDVLRSSPTLTRYGAIATSGNSTGKVVITYDVLANSIAESVGVSYIEIYKSNGDYVTTIYASSINGFTTSGSGSHRNSYTYTGTSGTYYYAEVTVFATIGGVTDSRTVTTNTVKAP